VTDVSTIFFGLLAGSFLGAVFYGGLWWTVRRFSGRAVGPWLVGSFVLRTVIVLAGFFAVARGPWAGLAACFTSFFAARLLVTRWAQSPSATTAGALPLI